MGTMKGGTDYLLYRACGAFSLPIQDRVGAADFRIGGALTVLKTA